MLIKHLRNDYIAPGMGKQLPYGSLIPSSQWYRSMDKGIKALNNSLLGGTDFRNSYEATRRAHLEIIRQRHSADKNTFINLIIALIILGFGAYLWFILSLML